MSEFERSKTHSARTPASGKSFPEDFSPEEAAFASDLRELFPLEHEELPPLYTHTLIEDDWHAPTADGYEAKMAYQVFDRLSLPRRPLFERNGRSGLLPFGTFGVLRASRPVVGAVATVLMVMLFSIIVATPSFAAGINLLLRHTGVVQVRAYPQDLVKRTAQVGPRATSRVKPQIPTDMTISWLGPKAGKYVYLGARALDEEAWSRGSVVDIQYVVPGQTAGSGVLDIREFRVADNYEAVLQVVQEGAATLARVGDNRAVYVNGTWKRAPAHVARMQGGVNPVPYWESNVRSELILERGDTVIWISADQRDGTGMRELLQFASMLTTASGSDLRQRMPGGMQVDPSHTLASLFTSSDGFEVYELVRPGQAVGSGVNAFVISGEAR